MKFMKLRNKSYRNGKARKAVCKIPLDLLPHISGEPGVAGLVYLAAKHSLNYSLLPQSEGAQYISICPELGRATELGDTQEDALFYLLEACSSLLEDYSSAAEWDEIYHTESERFLASGQTDEEPESIQGEITLEDISQYLERIPQIYGEFPSPRDIAT